MAAEIGCLGCAGFDDRARTPPCITSSQLDLAGKGNKAALWIQAMEDENCANVAAEAPCFCRCIAYNERDLSSVGKVLISGKGAAHLRKRLKEDT